MSEKKELNPSPKFPSGDYPKLSPNPNQVDGLVNKTGEQPNTQFVNESKVQPIKNLTIQQIIELIQKYAPKGDTLPEVTSADNEKVLEVINGIWAKGNKKVNVIDAPASTILTDEQIAKIIDGVFVNGEFLTKKNPVFFPATDQTTDYVGFIMGQAAGYQTLSLYNINKSTKEISLFGEFTRGITIAKTAFQILGVTGFNGKQIPGYSSNSVVGTYICRKGILEWYVPVAQNNITSGDVIALASNLGKALIDHLEVEINGFRARYEYTSGNYVVYSSKSEADGGLKLQVNMISYNTTNGELSFNQMTFTPDN